MGNLSFVEALVVGTQVVAIGSTEDQDLAGAMDSQLAFHRGLRVEEATLCRPFLPSHLHIWDHSKALLRNADDWVYAYLQRVFST